MMLAKAIHLIIEEFDDSRDLLDVFVDLFVVESLTSRI